MNRSSISWSVVSRSAALAALLLFPACAHAAPQLSASPKRLSPQALRQIEALEAEADARTPAQRKISSPLLYTLKMARGQQIAPGIQTLRTGVQVDGQGLTLVDIDAAVSPDLLSSIVRAGGQVVHASPQFGQVRARVPVLALEALASAPGIRFIKPAVPAQLNGVVRPNANKRRADLLAPYVLPVPERMSLSARKASVRAALPSLLTKVAASFPGPIANTGSVTSEGDKAHQADKARSTYGISGSGIKVGVLSDSIDDTNDGGGYYTAAVNSGDVSTVTVISGQAGTGEGEGLAMLEIVHDLAPGAQLYFATGFGGEASMADNIVALQKAGCKVIIDDVSYFDESPFQDATIAKAVNTVTAAGSLFFSSAANNGNLDAGKSSVWEGDFKDSGDTLSDGKLHVFTSGYEGNLISTLNSGQISLSLFWADPLGKSSNDYDLFIFDNSGSTVLASSTNRQTGGQDPYESAKAEDGDLAAIVLHSGSTRFLHLDINNQNSTLESATTGRTRGHNAGLNTFSCAATPAADGTPDGPSGPYPNPFNSSNMVETFSNDGPRRIFFNPDGSAITSGNYTHTGGSSLKKPDFTAADGVSTTLPAGGLNPFFGTSASAPHAGAIAALILSRNNTLTRSQVATILDNSATDIMASGYDVDAGYGILNALKALQNTPAPTSSVKPKSLSFSPNPVIGGQDTTGTLTLTGAAPSGGAAVTITENGTSIGTITVPAGSTSTTFTLTPPTVTATETDTIGAVYNGTTVTTTLTVNPPASSVTLSSLVLTPTSVTAGQTSTGKVTLSAVAPTGGVTITLKSSDTSSATVPSSVTIDAGNKSKSFTITTKSVTGVKKPTITASVGSSTKTATLTINPAATVTIKSLTVSPTSVVGGSANSTGTITLTGPAPAGGLAVTQTSSDTSAATLAGTLNIAAGATSANFKITTYAVTSTKTVTITSTANGTSKTATLTVTGTGSKVTPTSLTFNPDSISSDGQSTGTVTLSGAAPSGGAAVDISYQGSTILTATVPAGKTSTTFGLNFGVVSSTTTFSIDATYNVKTVSGSVTVKATTVKPTKLSLSPSTVTSGGSTTGTVTLSATAPKGGAVVEIFQGDDDLGYIVVPGGQTSTTFTYTPASVSSTTKYTESAVYNNVTVTATLTVNPGSKM